jgi:hypothetical protein
MAAVRKVPRAAHGAKAPSTLERAQRNTGPAPGELPSLILPASGALPRELRVTVRRLLIFVRLATSCGTQLAVFDAPHADWLLRGGEFPELQARPGRGAMNIPLTADEFNTLRPVLEGAGVAVLPGGEP